jgi:SAM-dependent methyltransferase
MPIPRLTMSAWLRFDAIRRGLELADPSRVLEIGAGEGALGGWLAQRYEYVGVEPDARARAVAVARTGGKPMMRAALEDSDAGGVDLVCAFEVLEHIERDAEALVHWRRRLQPRGWLLISVPAHASRFGASDRYVGHFRRYDRESLRPVLETAGFEIVDWRSYGAGLGHVIERVRNRLLSRRAATSAAEGTALSGRLFQPRSNVRVWLNYLAALPFRVAQLPFASTDVGIGYVVLARLRAS